MGHAHVTGDVTGDPAGEYGTERQEKYLNLGENETQEPDSWTAAAHEAYLTRRDGSS